MNRDEQDLIRNLFGKLGDAERAAPPRDGEADRFIQESVSAQPGAPYYMAQTIIMQEQALEAAQARIEELEAQNARPQSSGGFFGSLFGGAQQPTRPTAWPSAYGAPPPGRGGSSGPWSGAGGQGARNGAAGYGQAAHGQAGYAQPGRSGGGFLAGAAQTAMGVAGGVLLGSMLSNAFAGADPAAAVEGAVADAGEAAGIEPASFEDAGAEDFGGFDEI